MTDGAAKFSTSIGWNLGERTGRYAIVIDNGKIVYASKDEDTKSIEVSGAQGVLAHL
jgi:alkyl hydroperoxide reductase 1